MIPSICATRFLSYVNIAHISSQWLCWCMFAIWCEAMNVSSWYRIILEQLLAKQTWPKSLNKIRLYFIIINSTLSLGGGRSITLPNWVINLLLLFRRDIRQHGSIADKHKYTYAYRFYAIRKQARVHNIYMDIERRPRQKRNSSTRST